MADENNHRPTHRAYAVTRGEQKNFWREIGAAWAHTDGDGLTVRLECFPLNGAEIVLRKPLPADRDGRIADDRASNSALGERPEKNGNSRGAGKGPAPK